MAGYIRVDVSNNIADGNVIAAADLDNEFDGVQAAFNASTGHTHGGGVGEGAPITKLGPSQDVTISTTLLAPKTTNTVDIGSSSLKYKDLYLTGAIYTGRGIVTSVNAQTTTTSPWAWSSDSYDQQSFSALANALTINADAGTPTDGQQAIFRFTDNGTARALTWTTGTSKSFRVMGVELPTTTVPNKTVYVGCIYNIAASRWDVVAVAQEE